MSRPYWAGEHQKLEWFGHSVMEILLDSQATNGALFMARISMAAGDGTPVHQHSREDEVFVVLGGSAVFWYDEDRYDAHKGAVIYLPRDVPHCYTTTSDTELLAICTPSGVEAFFRTAGHDLATDRPTDWSLTPSTMAAPAAESGMQILGAPRPA